MWFYIPLAFLLVLALAGGVFMGGVFTLALVPLAGLAVIFAIGYALAARATHARAGGGTHASHTTSRALPHATQGSSGRTRTSPEHLADARRTHQ